MALQFGICIVIAFYGYNMLEVYGSHYLCTGLILCAIIIAYLSAQIALSGSRALFFGLSFGPVCQRSLAPEHIK